MEKTKKYLSLFFRECDFGDEASEALLSAFAELEKSEKLSRLYLDTVARYDGENFSDFDGVNASCKELADGSGVHIYTVNLLVYAAMSERLKQRYEERGIGLEIFKNSMMDFKYKLEECRLVKGVFGNFVVGWESGFLKMKLFGLGRLQFEIVPFGMEATVGEEVLHPDTKVINIHIPRTGGRLDHAEVEESYKMAKEFFKDYFKGRRTAFVCSSWLLWQEHLNMLPEGSNIRAFIGDFTIVKEKTYDDYSAIWRLFDTEYDGDANHLPADSTLRRKYVEHIKAGKPTGSAKGVFFLD